MAEKVPSSQTEKQKKKKLYIEIVRQMLTLATAGFGLVSALAWNSLIQELVSTYIKEWLPFEGKIVSLLIYAVIVTALAVIITLQLSRIVRRLEDKN